MKKQRIQCIIELSKKGDSGFIDYLVSLGYENYQNLKYDDLKLKYLFVDIDKFFSASITCLAAACSCGKRPISEEQFKSCFEKNEQECLDKK